SIPSTPVQKKPGETLSLSCKGSGFTFGNYYILSSCPVSFLGFKCYSMHWIRQKAGGGLEWIGRVNSGSTYDPDYAASLKGQFTLTEDVSKSTQYLEAKSLKAEDTALYYCARDSH
uniref:Ig-like domain-containing protein n=1 Tax=Scleropages formosus TaxID=113540 RepID=A0A8C9U6T2_SCLFO